MTRFADRIVGHDVNDEIGAAVVGQLMRLARFEEERVPRLDRVRPSVEGERERRHLGGAGRLRPDAGRGRSREAWGNQNFCTK